MKIVLKIMWKNGMGFRLIINRKIYLFAYFATVN